ncbi:MAG: transglycosylase domain-containing protein [bacterium]|nr:transglycosylase domain-containing protein [bacterium]
MDLKSLKEKGLGLIRKIGKVFSSILSVIRKTRKIIFWSMILTIGILGTSYVYYVYVDRKNMPDIQPFIRFEPPVIGQIKDSNNQTVIELATEYRRIINYDRIPLVIRGAILSAEDSRFFSSWWIAHHGIDYLAMLRAASYNFPDTIRATYHNNWKITVINSQGASTLTQQIVRLYFLTAITSRENSDNLIQENFVTRTLAYFTSAKTTNKYVRKLREIKYSVWLEKELTKYYGSREEAKRQIFIRFANYTYFGNGRYGVEATSEYYFGKSASELTQNDADKAALIAGMIKNPAVYGARPNQSDEAREIQKERRDKILLLMTQESYITEDQKKKFIEKELEFVFKRERTIAPSVVNETFNEMKSEKFEIMNIFQGNINIHTTVDLKVQKIVNEACENGLAEYEKRHSPEEGQTQCSAIVLKNNSGAILAEVGGRSVYQGRTYQYSDLNRVNRARQAGSSFKPFVYLTAFMNGWKPDDIILDSPVAISMGYGRGNHWIHNYDGKYLGNITMCEALYRSRNAPTIRLVLNYLGTGSFDDSGMKKVIDTTRLLGVKSPFHSDTDHLGRTVYYPTSALGASEMTVIELANAYREMASGVSAEPYIIQRVIDRNGKVLFEQKENRQISEISPEALDMIRSCLRKVVTQPGGTAYSLTLENFPVPIAGKTGTTDDFRNALFAGWTHGPEGITVVARIDFDDNHELGSGETGARTALPIVKEIFRKVYEQNLVGPAPQFPAHLEQWRTEHIAEDILDIQQ